MGRYSTWAARSKEQDLIVTEFSQISSWLDEEGFDADAVTYEDKLSQLKSLTGPLLRRVREHEERPDAIKALTAKLDAAAGFAKAIRDKTKEALDAAEETIFTPVEIDVLDKLITETKVRFLLYGNKTKVNGLTRINSRWSLLAYPAVLFT